MQKMLVLLLLLQIVLVSCGNRGGNLSGSDMELIPFFQWYPQNRFGFINAETFEIVIPRQYSFASNFIGDFAVVARNRDRASFMVINRNNDIILRNLFSVSLIQCEGGTVYALVGRRGRSEGTRWIATGGMLPSIARSRHPNTYTLHNLHLGRVVLRDAGQARSITFFGNYLVVGGNLYERQHNGTFERSSKDIDEVVTKILRERNLEHLLWGGWDSRLQRFDWRIDTIDIDSLVQNVPDNLRIRHRRSLTYLQREGRELWELGEDDWADRLLGINTSNSRITIINRNPNQPFQKREWLYRIDMFCEEGEIYTGLYNAYLNVWKIPPIQYRQTIHDSWATFFQFGDWIHYYENRVWGERPYQRTFNIRTGKQFSGIFSTHVTGGRSFYYDGFNEW